MRERPSPNFDARPPGQDVDVLVLHYTGMKTAAAALDRLCDPAAEVSSHYLVEEDGTVWRLVAEEHRAWHAGTSFWRGMSGLNGRSIGIEIANPGHEWGCLPFPPAQMAAVRDLCHAILARHPIPARNLVAHSDIAPERKQDPGELFDWAGLARDGIGLWPEQRDEAAPAPDRAATLLGAIGYGFAPATEASLADCLRAFQRRWHPHCLSGAADPATMARLATVARAFADTFAGGSP